MAIVRIPKDLNKVQDKVAFHLTKRQLIGFVIAGIVSLPVFFVAKKFLAMDISMFLMFIVAFPILFVTFYNNDGLPCEIYLKYIYIYKYKQIKKRKKQKISKSKNVKKVNNLKQGGEKIAQKNRHKNDETRGKAK